MHRYWRINERTLKRREKNKRNRTKRSSFFFSSFLPSGKKSGIIGNKIDEHVRK